jgi:uncharacterized tellurite resistance protein B-like protein
MSLLRLLGIGQSEQLGPVDDQPETAAIRRIVGQLEQLEPERRRYLAGFAYLLGRAANADLDISAEETQLMERILEDIGGLPQAQAVLVVQIARNQAELYGGTEDYLVTRDFAARATAEQRRAAVEACYAVVAVDHAINAEEAAELKEIATELGLTRRELNEIRRKFGDQLTVVQQMRGER